MSDEVSDKVSDKCVLVFRLGAQPPSVMDVPQRIRGMKPLSSGMQPSAGPIQLSDSSQTEGQQRSDDTDEILAASEAGSRHHGGDKDLVWIIDPKTGKEKGVTPDQLRHQVLPAIKANSVPAPPPPPSTCVLFD